MTINIHHYPKALRQSEATAALRRIYVAPQLAGAAVTGLGSGGSWAAAEIQVSINGGGFTNYAGTMSELAAGMYSYELTSGELGNAGSMCIKFAKTGIDTTFVIVPVQVWNFNAVTNGLPDVNVGTMTDNVLVTAKINDGAFTAAKFASGAITAVARGHTTAAVSGTGTTTVFATSLSQTADGFWTGAFVKITSGALIGCGGRRVTAYNGTTKELTVTPAYPSVPANAVTFELITD